MTTKLQKIGNRFSCCSRSLKPSNTKHESTRISISPISLPSLSPISLDVHQQTDGKQLIYRFFSSLFRFFLKIGAVLQGKLCLVIKEMITFQTKYSDILKKWSNKWINFFQQDEPSFSAYKSTIQLLLGASLIGNHIAEQINQSTEELERICKSVPIELQQTHSAVNQAKRKLGRLKKKKPELHNGLNPL